MTDDAAAPITQVGITVLVQGAALPVLFRACLALIARCSRDGLAADPLLQLARTTLYRACMSQPRHEEAPLSAPGPYSGRLTAATPVHPGRLRRNRRTT